MEGDLSRLLKKKRMKSHYWKYGNRKNISLFIWHRDRKRGSMWRTGERRCEYGPRLRPATQKETYEESLLKTLEQKKHNLVYDTETESEVACEEQGRDVVNMDGDLSQLLKKKRTKSHYWKHWNRKNISLFIWHRDRKRGSMWRTGKRRCEYGRRFKPATQKETYEESLLEILEQKKHKLVYMTPRQKAR